MNYITVLNIEGHMENFMCFIMIVPQNNEYLNFI